MSNAVKVNVSPENPVQELGGGWKLEYSERTFEMSGFKIMGVHEECIRLKHKSSSLSLTFAVDNAQKAIDTLQAALTNKETAAAPDCRIESILGVSVDGFDELIAEYNKCSFHAPENCRQIAKWVRQLREDLHRLTESEAAKETTVAVESNTSIEPEICPADGGYCTCGGKDCIGCERNPKESEAQG
jgi:hypothetical protein